ncbi:MAG: PEGA domain-containing protein [Myxococcales bacterium]|nr:PEGA domain-containing protein [Myxococcales bacterium]
MVGRWLSLAVVMLVITTASARAESARTVRVETTPPGATVYLGDKSGAALGTTPAEIKLTPGDYVLVIELDGYLDELVPVPVPAVSGKAARKPIDLEPILMRAAESMLEVRGEAPDGARVVVDGEDRGTLPRRLEIMPGPHQVQVIAGGKAVWDEWVELDSGAEHVVTVAPKVEAPAPEPVGPRGPRPPLVTVRVGPDFGWRDLSYSNGGDAMFTPSFSSKGLVAIRIEAELAPWRLAPAARPVWPLALVVGGGFAPADTVVAGTSETDQFWRTTEVGLRYRVGLGRHAAIGADVGWARLLWAFRGDREDALPDSDYQTVRLGLRGEGSVGPLAGWLTIANQVVASGGPLPDRFASADADGLGLRAGALARLWHGRIEAGFEYQLVRFTWAFANDNLADYQADGATDRFDSFRLWVGGAY